MVVEAIDGRTELFVGEILDTQRLVPKVEEERDHLRLGGAAWEFRNTSGEPAQRFTGEVSEGFAVVPPCRLLGIPCCEEHAQARQLVGYRAAPEDLKGDAVQVGR